MFDFLVKLYVEEPVLFGFILFYFVFMFADVSGSILFDCGYWYYNKIHNKK